jgi:hypothetical protein
MEIYALWFHLGRGPHLPFWAKFSNFLKHVFYLLKVNVFITEMEFDHRRNSWRGFGAELCAGRMLIDEKCSTIMAWTYYEIYKYGLVSKIFKWSLWKSAFGLNHFGCTLSLRCLDGMSRLWLTTKTTTENTHVKGIRQYIFLLFHFKEFLKLYVNLFYRFCVTLLFFEIFELKKSQISELSAILDFDGYACDIISRVTQEFYP